MHERGICHLDLSLENVLGQYDEQGDLRIKIIDFGCAAKLEPDPARPFASAPLVEARFPPGKMRCMAPELLEGSRDNPTFHGMHCDIWSCGVMLVELLHGQLWKSATVSDEVYEAFAAGIEASTGLERLSEMRPTISQLSTLTKELVLGLLQPKPVLRLTHVQVLPLLTPEWMDASESRGTVEDPSSFLGMLSIAMLPLPPRERSDDRVMSSSRQSSGKGLEDD